MPISFSRTSIRLATVGCAKPNLRDAANVEPSLTTIRNTRMSDQLRKAFFIFEEQHNKRPNTRTMIVPLELGRHHKLRKGLKMTTLSFSSYIWHRFAAIFNTTARSHDAEANHEFSAEQRTAEQDLIKDMMWSNPETFSSELSALYIFHGFYGKY